MIKLFAFLLLFACSCASTSARTADLSIQEDETEYVQKFSEVPA